jgi:hypothetical protein
VVPKLDRLARSVPDARDIGDTLVAHGVRLSLGGSIYDPAPPSGGNRQCAGDGGGIGAGLVNGNVLYSLPPPGRGPQPSTSALIRNGCRMVGMVARVPSCPAAVSWKKGRLPGDGR